jgi:hypothetical protein
MSIIGFCNIGPYNERIYLYTAWGILSRRGPGYRLQCHTHTHTHTHTHAHARAQRNGTYIYIYIYIYIHAYCEEGQPITEMNTRDRNKRICGEYSAAALCEPTF